MVGTIRKRAIDFDMAKADYLSHLRDSIADLYVFVQNFRCKSLKGKGLGLTMCVDEEQVDSDIIKAQAP